MDRLQNPVQHREWADLDHKAMAVVQVAGGHELKGGFERLVKTLAVIDAAVLSHAGDFRNSFRKNGGL